MQNCENDLKKENQGFVFYVLINTVILKVVDINLDIDQGSIKASKKPSGKGLNEGQ